MRGADSGYWNHNTAFHREIVARAAGRRVLDVGCGDGLLATRLARVADEVVAIDPDPRAVGLARRRCEGLEHVTVFERDLFQREPGLGRFGLVTVVAVLHHVPLEAGLRRLRDLVAPGGRLVIVGLARESSLLDLLIGALSVPHALVMDRIHRKSDPDVVIADAQTTFDEVRAAVRTILPGARIRRRRYYRYTVEWERAAAGG